MAWEFPSHSARELSRYATVLISRYRNGLSGGEHHATFPLIGADSGKKATRLSSDYFFKILTALAKSKERLKTLSFNRTKPATKL